MCTLQLREENNWLLIWMSQTTSFPETKLIALTNPNNPTGSLIDEMLNEIADIAILQLLVLCDEVYRGTDQHGSGMTASIAI